MEMTTDPLTTITATVSAGNATDALVYVTKRCESLGDIDPTGRVAERSIKHLLWDVELTVGPDTDRNDAWVMLTSYGISPSDDLGSAWQTVAGVGA